MIFSLSRRGFHSFSSLTYWSFTMVSSIVPVAAWWKVICMRLSLPLPHAPAPFISTRLLKCWLTKLNSEQGVQVCDATKFNGYSAARSINFFNDVWSAIPDSESGSIYPSWSCISIPPCTTIKWLLLILPGCSYHLIYRCIVGGQLQYYPHRSLPRSLVHPIAIQQLFP